jgi:hypothetical protein
VHRERGHERVRDEGRQRLDQVAAGRVGDLLDEPGDVPVVDRVLDTVGRRFLHLELDVEEKRLPLALLALQHPVVAEHLEPVQLDFHRTPLRRRRSRHLRSLRSSVKPTLLSPAPP